MKKGLIAVLVIIGLVWLFSSIFKKDKYIGFYYPDRYNLSNDIQSDGFFDSLEQCRAWVNTQVSKYSKEPEDYDYECGKNCKLQNGQKPYVCEETLE